MAIDFELPADLRDLQARIRAFIVSEVIPLEHDPRRTPHGPAEELKRALNDKARAAGLLSPHVAREYGGLALSHVGRAVAFEEAGYSTLGPVALNVAAPDEGNMHLLEAVATPAQKERWLRPLATATIRSCFCMTEPPPGSGSDPSMLATTATRDGDHFVISGCKWFITGAEGAAFAIIMAEVEGAGATMFLSDMNASGIVVERSMGSLDTCFPGGHGVVRFEALRVPATDVLGEVGKGFKYAQVRLSPARLTHCMRWLGAARRAHDVAADYARKRTAFGKPIGEHEGVGFMLADNEMELAHCRLAVWHAAWLLDQGEHARTETSQCKVYCSEALSRVVDRSLQVLGGMGITADTVVQRIYREIRPFRIYDGPSEVHRFALARRIVGGADDRSG